LYVFSLRDDSEDSIEFLKYLCGLLNSNIYTFFAQKRRIIRYNKGKQPQIKTSDLYQIYIPQDRKLMQRIVELVDKIYKEKINIEKYKNEIDIALYEYYSLTQDEVITVNNSIESFLR
jgi:ADP-heptose:LPS heptosyltransferase